MNFKPLHLGAPLDPVALARFTLKQLERALTSVPPRNVPGGGSNGFLRAINTVTGFINDKL